MPWRGGVSDPALHHTARMIVSGLEGAMLVAQPYRDIARFQAAAANLLSGLARATAKPAPTGPGPAAARSS